VCNYIRKKTGEIETYKVMELGTLKWRKEHIPRHGNDLTEERQILLEDPELCLNRDKMGECLKKTQVRHQDQRRILE
jgi:hypothetical protein